MKMHKCNRQRGVNLIELMVGMTISLIVVLAMLAIFKVTVFATANAGKAAAKDRERLSGFFTAQKLLTGAGYGIDAPAFGKDLVLLTGATLTSGQLSGSSAILGASNINAIVWGANVDGTQYKCQGLYAPSTGGLVRLSETACVDATKYSQLTWGSIKLIEDTRAVTITAGRVTECQSFGIAGSGWLSINLATTNSIDSTSGAVSSPACLLNFPS